MKTLAERHDCLLLDLDGTVYRGPAATEGAVDALTGHRARALFVTNNASSSPTEVARHLCELGVAATPDDVVTSAQSAAGLLVQQLGAGARVLVLGTEALADEVRAVGLTPVRRYKDSPAAVVQGHSPSTGWPQLSEAALAIRAGAIWVATNLDATLPTERGLLPGNGSMVAALASATGRKPEVAGKPSAAIVANALSRGHFQSPLVIGDRLDTDVAGANAAGLPSVLVLTGVCTASDVVNASPEQRPTYLSRDLRGLHEPADEIAVAPQSAWHVDIASAAITVTATGVDPGADGLSVLRAVAHALWDNTSPAHPPEIRPGDDAAWIALHRWSLLPEAEAESARVRSASGSRSLQPSRTPA
jgi:HAD superfamily hydrolase (TIGR01450 family)